MNKVNYIEINGTDKCLIQLSGQLRDRVEFTLPIEQLP